MRRWLLTTACGLAAGLMSAAAAFAELPASFRGWQSSAAETISMPQLSSAAGQNAAVLREYGFLGGERRVYQRGSDRLTVTVWRMQDATGSFGLFTFLTEPGMQSEEGGHDVLAFGNGAALLQRGPYLLEARGEALTREDASALSSLVASIRPDENLLPPVLSYLPGEAFVPQSQRLIIGPAAFGRVMDRVPGAAVGFQSGAEAALADYRSPGDAAATRLLLISYPTPQLAAKMLESFQSLPALARSEPGRTVFVERKSSLIAFVFDAPSLAAAEALLDRVNYEANLTWNEYVPPRRENVGRMMMALFSLAGIVLLGAFVAGLALGGFRVLAKKFIPIPIFDRPAQTEFIRLDLNGK